MADKQYFANRELAYYQQFISKEKVLDESALLTVACLNERQIEQLKPMLLAAKMIVDAPPPAPVAEVVSYDLPNPAFEDLVRELDPED
jgi:hypothetical protein